MKGETPFQHVEREVHLLKEELVEKIPSHFNAKHIASAFIGSLLMGLTFVLSKQLIFEIAPAFQPIHIISIILVTTIILTAEIYFIGYARVKDKEKRVRRFGQFWIKRFVSYYGIALLTSIGLFYLYGYNQFLVHTSDVAKTVVAVSLPAAVGASLADLLKQY